MGRIDVHHHMLPPDYAQTWKDSGGIPPGLTLPEWTVDLDISFMDRNNIDVALLSLSAPGVSFTSAPEQATTLSRQANKYAAAVRDAHPDRFGFFATLPLDDIPSSLKELHYALDVLKADGVTLFTSYNGKYLGHPDIRPLWQELDRRGTVVFIHPTSAKDPGAPHDRAIPRPIIDFPHETTRTAVHLITSNTVRDYPGCKIILSHGGGTLPYVATRIAYLAADAGLVLKPAEEFLEDAKKFYFDLASTSYKDPVQLLQSFALEDHILWGSDFPFAREKTVVLQIETLESLDLNHATRSSIMNSAALKLFPRLSSAQS